MTTKIKFSDVRALTAEIVASECNDAAAEGLRKTVTGFWYLQKIDDDPTDPRPGFFAVNSGAKPETITTVFDDDYKNDGWPCDAARTYYVANWDDPKFRARFVSRVARFVWSYWKTDAMRYNWTRKTFKSRITKIVRSEVFNYGVYTGFSRVWIFSDQYRFISKDVDAILHELELINDDLREAKTIATVLQVKRTAQLKSSRPLGGVLLGDSLIQLKLIVDDDFKAHLTTEIKKGGFIELELGTIKNAKN